MLLFRDLSCIAVASRSFLFNQNHFLLPIMFAGIFIAFAVNQVCGQMRDQRKKFLKEKDFPSSFSSPGSPSSKSLTSPISISQERQRRPLPIFPPGTRTRLVDPHSYLGFDPKVQLVETALHNPFLNPEVCTGEVVWVQEGSGKKEIFHSTFATTTSNQHRGSPP